MTSPNLARFVRSGLIASLAAMATLSFGAPPPSSLAATPSTAASATRAPGAFGQTMSDLWHFIMPKHDVQVITVTDATPKGALLRTPSPANPVYYIAVNAGYHDFGAPIAGIKPPAPKEVIATIAKVLAKQGYLPATEKHPPTQILMMAWGTMNVETFDPSGQALSPSEAPQVNRRQLLRFMGAYKLGMISKDRSGFQDETSSGLMFYDATQQDFMDAASDDLYVAAVASYDYQAMVQKQKVLLWTTKISCPSIGLDLRETLPTMIAIAGPHFGRETAKPVWVNASEKYKPDVQIGEAKVIEMFDPERLPVVDATKAKAKAKTPPKTDQH